MPPARPLHFVFKIVDRVKSATFYREVLGMKFLRHEEFEKGCEAACNGPYDGKWSKSMVGYGSEDDHFVVELTYNYGIGTYKLGNDFRGMTIKSKAIINNAKKANWPVHSDAGKQFVEAPEGYRFYIEEEDPANDVTKVSLSSSNLQKSIDFWQGKCGMKLYSQEEKTALLGYADDMCKLELVDIGQPVEHAKAYGRIAFSTPEEELPGLEKAMREAGETVLTPLTRLDTPGKASAVVVILADPDGHEICFVGDVGFRDLSKPDVDADKLLDEAMAADKSSEWYAKKGKSKPSA